MNAWRLEVIAVKTKQEEQQDRKGLYQVKAAEKLSDRELGLHLCYAGPVMCEECGLCAYGNEFVRREQKRMTGITQHEMALKYGACPKDVSGALARLKPIGYKKKDSAAGPARLYDEQQAAHALAGMWRAKAGQYERLAAMWNERAKKAERLAAGLREGTSSDPLTRATFPCEGKAFGRDDMDEKQFSGLIDEEFG